MATAKNAKKKSAAKTAVNYATKAKGQASKAAPHTAASTMQQADWQKNASEWAKQSAKLYKFPLAQSYMESATPNAAESMKSATDQMTKMCMDMMQQCFGQSAKNAESPFAMASFFPAASASKRDGAVLAQFVEGQAKSAASATSELNAIVKDMTETLTQVGNVAATVSKEMMAESISCLNKRFANHAEYSKQILSCRTLNDLFDLSTSVAKSNLDSFFSQSVRFSEMLFQCATDIADPLNACVSDANERLSKAVAA